MVEKMETGEKSVWKRLSNKKITVTKRKKMTF